MMAHRSKLATMLGVTQQGGLQLGVHCTDCVLHHTSEIALPECNEEQAAVLGPWLLSSTLYATQPMFAATLLCFCAYRFSSLAKLEKLESLCFLRVRLQ